MSFTLHDMGQESYQFSANVWNWKALLEIIKGMDVLSEGKVRQMGYNAMGVKVEQDDARLIGAKLRDEILPKLEPNKRMFSDGTVTDEPDDGTIYKDEDEQWKNYFVTYLWVKDLSDFCLRSKGFQIF
ncbi:hypothetical protein [Leptolyngbya sp. 7M]|uniref:hypothetical protein n=1 Tax=Leptolyngbya sp. 7M TaxID=2812896 RepID=UPI001B8C1888|nr:hypothetical protein [Leptolyngbya sp. 7M]QYO65905.1 hypothetical protein JVX88_03655 [Leptolyngbya sp. 7M]